MNAAFENRTLWGDSILYIIQEKFANSNYKLYLKCTELIFKDLHMIAHFALYQSKS